MNLLNLPDWNIEHVEDAARLRRELDDRGA